MAENLNINRCWFHKKNNFSHYDIPKKRIKEIESKCHIITTKNLIKLIKNENSSNH